MSRLPLAGVTASYNSIIPTPTRRLSSANDIKKRRTLLENTFPAPQPSKSTGKARSRSFTSEPNNNQQQSNMALRHPLTISPKPMIRQQSTTRSSISSFPFYLGERVAVDSLGIVGTLMFLGETEFKEGFWAGIQLDIIGSGKNDGSVKGIRYFTCPPQTGLFVLASKLSALDTDFDSVRSLSPPMMTVQQSNNHTSPHSTMFTNSSKAARGYVSQRQPSSQSKKKGVYTPPLSVRYTQPSMFQTPLTSPTSTTTGGSSSARNSLRRSQHYNRGIPSPAVTPTNHSVHENADDYYHDVLLSTSDDMLITETPMPEEIALSKSLTTNDISTSSFSFSSSSSSSSSFDPSHESLKRMVDEAPNETVMRLQQLQLRLEVLEAENKSLKLENTQNKAAEHSLEHSLILKKKTKKEEEEEKEEDQRTEGCCSSNETTLPSQADVEENHVSSEQQQQQQEKAIQSLETRIKELEEEQQQLISERDRALLDVSVVREEKNQIEHRMQELEAKVAETEAAIAAAAQASERLCSEKAKSLQPQYFQAESDVDRQMQLEMEMQEIHEKMSSLREAARAKDIFLASLTEQVETHRNAVEEKEREIRRVKADSERHVREKERLLEELKEVESKWLAHQDCTPKESFDRLKKELLTVKENYAKESALVLEYQDRITQLQQSVDELQRAGIESIELYERTTEMHRVDREAMNASLVEGRRKIDALEMECEELRKVALDTMETYEKEIAKLNQEHQNQLDSNTARCNALQETVDSLKQELSQRMANEEEKDVALLKESWESDRKRLMNHIEELENERASLASFKSEAASWEEKSKELEKLTKENRKLEEQLIQLQADYDQQRATYLDELKRQEEEVEAKKKLEMELQPSLPTMTIDDHDHEQQCQRDMEATRNEVERLKEENAILLKQKEEIEKNQEDTAKYQQMIASLKADNKKLAKDHAELQESHKQTQVECLKLMEEIERLHQQASQDEATKLILKEDSKEDDKIAKLMQQNQKNLEQLSIQHATELRKVREEAENVEKEQKQKIMLLNKDISDLESLIESNVFKEADLEEALENERKMVKKLQLELEDAKDEKESMIETSSTCTKKEEEEEDSKALTVDDSIAKEESSEVYCEICENYGHDLISCKAVSLPEDDSKRFYCDNCEEYDLHITEKCPKQNEIF